MPKRKKDNVESEMDTKRASFLNEHEGPPSPNESPHRPHEGDQQETDNLGTDEQSALHPVIPLPNARTFADRSFAMCSSKGLKSTGKPDIRPSLMRSISERYQQIFHCVGNIQGNFARYRFHEKGPHRKPLADISVKNMNDRLLSSVKPVTLHFAENELRSSWMNLSKKGKANLFRLLQIPQNLWFHLKYSQEEGIWMKKEERADNDSFIVLQHYGVKSSTSNICFTERLMEGRKKEELNPVVDKVFMNYWDSALKTSMSYGEGHIAVFSLYQELINLLPEMNIHTPVEIFQTKNCLSKFDPCCVSTASPSWEETELSAPKKGEGDARKDDDDDDDDDDEVKPHKQLGDLVVVSVDENSGHAKYLAVIEIHSTGKTDQQAQSKFLKEVLHTLQAQDSVFGFFFSVTYVMYYYAKREVNGKIKVEEYKHVFTTESNSSEYDDIHVGAFQMLVMDMLSALLYGMQNINI